MNLKDYHTTDEASRRFNRKIKCRSPGQGRESNRGYCTKQIIPSAGTGGDSFMVPENGNDCFCMIPLEDRRSVRKHGGLALQDYWLDCWEADPYGSRYVLMPDTDLKNRNQRRYRKQLQDLGLFMFELRKNGNNYQLWILNRHGSRVRGYQKSERGYQKSERGYQKSERGYQKSERGYQKSERGYQKSELNPGIQFQSGFQKPSGSSQDILQDLFISLSEAEREIFLDFGRRKASQLPKPPELPDKWIAANWEDLYQQFQASQEGRKAKQEAIAAQYDWENDPRLMDWLQQSYNGGYLWTQEDEAEQEERTAFYSWAQETNAYEGRVQ